MRGLLFALFILLGGPVLAQSPQYGPGPCPVLSPGCRTNGGNARGANAVDWQASRSLPAQVASGASSTIAGGSGNTASNTNATVVGGASNAASGANTVTGGTANTVSGSSSVAFGNTNTASGTVSTIPGGWQATDRGRFGAECYSAGFLVAVGDAQRCQFILRVTTTGAAAVRLTSDGAGAGSTDCVNIPNNSAFALTVDVLAFDHTTVTKNSAWIGWQALLTRGANAASTAIVAGTTPTPLTNGTLTGQAIAMTADTTNGCVNISYTPPSANTDTFNVVASVRSVEVQ